MAHAFTVQNNMLSFVQSELNLLKRQFNFNTLLANQFRFQIEGLGLMRDFQ